MTPNSSNSYNLYRINTNSGLNNNGLASSDTNRGVRPILVTSKSNIK